MKKRMLIVLILIFAVMLTGIRSRQGPVKIYYEIVEYHQLHAGEV